ncbi:MAG TPA: SGNH/GDSL hydrolase family protein [bacterium]
MSAPLRRHLALLGASILAALAVAEVGLRVAGFSAPSFYTRDYQRGGVLRPGAAGLWNREGRDFVRISSRGLRDREHALAKPPGTLRIAVLGDSYAEAMQLPMEQTFWSVLERELGGCGALAGRRVEVINFGVSGYGTAQELLALRHDAWRYDPDVVVLAFVTGNDVRNNSRELERDPTRPYFVERDGRLVLDEGFRAGFPPPWRLRLREAASEVLNRVRVLQLLKSAADAAHAPAAPAPPAADTGASAGLDDEVYRPPRDAAWERAWRVTEGLLGLMADEVRAHGARLLVVSLSNPAQVHPDPAARQAYARARGIDDLFYPDRRIAAACARLGVPSLSLAPPLAERASRTGVFFHGFGGHEGEGHWNERGHRAAGELIAAELCRGLPAP